MRRCCCRNGICPAATRQADAGRRNGATIAPPGAPAWPTCRPCPTTLLLRDYHKDNLLWLPARPGVRACGLLDFQDAQQGHRCLRPRVADRGCPPRRLASRPCRLPGALHRRDRRCDEKDFKAGFALMAAQRHARIIGLFVRLLKRDGKPDYLPHLPRVWRHVRTRPAARGTGSLARLGRPPAAAAAAADRCA